jgi:hypothetical protein
LRGFFCRTAEKGFPAKNHGECRCGVSVSIFKGNPAGAPISIFIVYGLAGNVNHRLSMKDAQFIAHAQKGTFIRVGDFQIRAMV